MIGTLTIGRKPDIVINGTPVRAYTYVVPSGGVQSGGELYVATQTGLLLRSTGQSPRGTITLDYYDLGTSIAIERLC